VGAQLDTRTTLAKMNDDVGQPHHTFTEITDYIEQNIPVEE